MQPFRLAAGHPDLHLVAAWTVGDQRACLVRRLQAEVLQEAVRDLEVGNRERIVVKSRDHGLSLSRQTAYSLAGEAGIARHGKHSR